jgi:hypothetical protein
LSGAFVFPIQAHHSCSVRKESSYNWRTNRYFHMTPSAAHPRSRHKLALVLSALLSIVFFTACQFVLGLKDFFIPVSASPTGSVSSTPTARPTFTHLPGDMYFLYQTQTAAPTAYSTFVLQTDTPTPLRTLTSIVAASATASASACMAAYPDFCISPNVRRGCTALREIGKGDFTVRAPDPYGYDKDGDGIGCEFNE